MMVLGVLGSCRRWPMANAGLTDRSPTCVCGVAYSPGPGSCHPDSRGQAGLPGTAGHPPGAGPARSVPGQRLQACRCCPSPTTWPGATHGGRAACPAFTAFCRLPACRDLVIEPWDSGACCAWCADAQLWGAPLLRAVPCPPINACRCPGRGRRDGWPWLGARRWLWPASGNPHAAYIRCGDCVACVPVSTQPSHPRQPEPLLKHAAF